MRSCPKKLSRQGPNRCQDCCAFGEESELSGASKFESGWGGLDPSSSLARAWSAILQGASPRQNRDSAGLIVYCGWPASCGYIGDKLVNGLQCG